MPAGAGRSEAEWSCPNTGDGCNGILSLNDVHRGQRVITSSQLVYQPERDGEKTSQEEEEPATLRPLCCSSTIVSALACMFNLFLNKPPFSFRKEKEEKNHMISRSSDSNSAFEPQGVTFTLWQREIFALPTHKSKPLVFELVM